MAETANRFIKIDGGFERPGITAEEVGANLRSFALKNPGSGIDTAAVDRSLKGITSDTPASPLPESTPMTANNPLAKTGSGIESGAFDTFNNLLTGMLKKAQGVTTADYLSRKRALERSALGKSSEITPEELRTLSPAQQNAIRSGNVEALRPEIDANAYELEKAQQNIDSFFKVFTEAQKIGKDFADKMIAPASVIENAKRVIEADPDKMSAVLAGFNDKSKQKIIESLDYGKIGEKKSGDADADAQLYAGLTPATATAVRGQVSAWKGEPLVQNFATIQEGRNFAKSLSTDTKNPADDQALIYALAKALDPGSVVREGEYATAQKYAQSWVAAYGKGVTQAILGTGFLSKEARENIKKTIEQKYNSSRTSYDNLYKQYNTGINNLTGRDDGTKFIRDYIVPESSPAAGASGQTSSGLKYVIEQ